MLERAGAGALQVTVACRHSAERLLEELLCVTDCGCGLLDVTVEHPVYGQITAPLRIFSRADAEQFAGAIAGTQPLCQLTGGVHLHTLSCPTPYHRDRALASLREKGFLLGRARLARRPGPNTPPSNRPFLCPRTRIFLAHAGIFVFLFRRALTRTGKRV